MYNTCFEHTYCDLLIEEILYIREKNSWKNWGHIWWSTTISSYSRWNKRTIILPFPEDISFPDNTFQTVSLEWELNREFDEKQKKFLRKYNLFCLDRMTAVDDEDRVTFPKIAMIIDWFKGGYLRKFIWNIDDDCQLLFLFGISNEVPQEHDYYFPFRESIDTIWFQKILKSWMKNSDDIFVNIAIAWYLFHHHRPHEWQKFVLLAIKNDPNNPWFIWLYASMLTAIGGMQYLCLAEKCMERVLETLPNAPWVYDWMADTLLKSGKYTAVLSIIEQYDILTLWKYRTFEPYMKKAEAYVFLWDYMNAQYTLQKNEWYYFWAWYIDRLNHLTRSISILKEVYDSYYL